MNTKGIKFLAVLAVLAMVFVAFAATVPAEQDDATTAKDWTTNVTTATTIGSDEEWTVKGNVTVSATLTIEGSLVMSTEYYPTIITGGKIVLADGGRIVSTSSSYPIMVEATSADVLVVENGGIFGYYAATGETINLYGGIVGIKTGTAQKLDDNSETATSEITGQMITGAFTVSTDANLLFKIKGAINAYTTLDSADSGKYAIPRMGLYATFASGNYTYEAPVSTSGDLTIASGVSIFAAGLKVSKETTLTNNGYIYALKSGAFTAGTFQLETDSSNGGKFVNNGKAIGSVVVSSTTSIGTAIFNMPGNAGGDTPKYSEVLSITGYTLQYSGKLYLSGSLNKMTGQTDALTVTLASATYVPDNGSVIVGDKVTLTTTNSLNGTVCQTSESNKMILTAFKGTIVGGDVVTVDDASAEIEFVKGTYTGTIVTKVNKLTVDSSASVTFAAATGNVTEAHIYGTIAGTAVSNNNDKPTFAKTYLYAGSTADLTNIDSTATYDANAAEYIIHGKLEGDTVVGTAQLDDDLEIPEGYTLTVNSSLDLNGKILYVYGNLILSTGAEIIDSKDDSQTPAVDATIVLGPDSEFQNNGVLGRNATVKVALYENAISTTKCLTAQSIKGLSIAYGKVNKEAAMIIGGSITKTVPNLASVTPTLAVTTVFIDDMSVMTGVTLDDNGGKVTLMKGAEVEINTGATLAANLTVVYDSSITVNGLIAGATITAQTFIHKTAQEISSLTETDYDTTEFSSITGNNALGTYSVSGFTVAVDRVQYSGLTSVYYDQRAYVAGDLKIVLGTATAAASADLNIAGLAFVPAEYELNGWSNTNGVTAGIAGTEDLVVEGMVNNYSKMQSSTAKPFVGAKYSLTVAGVTTTYIANLADGIAMVGVAEEVIFSGNTIAPGTDGTDGYGVGAYELTADLEIPAGFIVSFGGTETTSDASLIIPEEISVKVMSGASLDAKVIAGLDGQVIVYEGGTCNNMTTDIYQVTWTEGTTKIYAGLAVALSKAAPGDVITFQGDNSASKIKAITIPSEVTLKVTGTLYVAKITVEEDGILYTTSSGSIIMKTNGSTYAGIANEGTMDIADGGFSFTGTPNHSVVTSTGALVYSTSTEFTDASVYGARISDDDGNYVLTTITLAALAGATEIDIPDKYVNLEKEYLLGATLNVTGNAAFVGLDITGSTLNVTGTVSGVITGISGTELEVVEVALDTFTGKLTDNYTLKTAEIYDYTFKSETAATVKGIEIASGKFTVGADINAVSATDKSIFVIDEDAVLTVSATDATIGSVLFKLIDIDGSVTVPSGKTLTIASPAVIDGEVTVTGKLETAELSIVGTLETASTGTPVIKFNGETEILGTLTVTSVASAVIGDEMYIGEPEIAAAPVIDGVLSFGADAFVIDYTGELDEDYFLYETGASAFMINDIDYFNVFFMGSNNLVSKVLDVADFTALIGLEIQNITNVTAWYDLATGKALATSATLEDEMTLLFVADITKVPLQMSWANGLSLYVDGVKMTTTNYSLAVGAHTVSAQVNAGYACDNMKITFDGAPITAAGIIITVDDTDSVIAVSGDVYVPEPEPVTPEEKSEWTITTILLCVLVVLIAIMAVIVALRLNRS